MIMGLLPLLAGSEMIKRSYRSSIIDQKLSELRYTCQTVAGQMSGNSLAEAVDDAVSYTHLTWHRNYKIKERIQKWQLQR